MTSDSPSGGNFSPPVNSTTGGGFQTFLIGNRSDAEKNESAKLMKERRIIIIWRRRGEGALILIGIVFFVWVLSLIP